MLKAMDKDLLCQWLGLPPKSWPPDYYTLLGLQRGESDLERIEEHVHQRLMQLRSYQLNYPELVTEAMNQIARAFTCLTDEKSRLEYEKTLMAQAENVAQVKEQPASPTSTKEEALLPPTNPNDPLAWLFGPWEELRERPEPTEQDWASSPPLPRTAATLANGKTEPVVLMSQPADPVLETARGSRAARRGLGSIHALCDRISLTREFLYLWDRVGKFLGNPKRRLVRQTEAVLLVRALHELQELLEEFPPILGRPGQPGYLVFALARQPLVVPTFRNLLPSQREALARDWQAARTMLLVHRRFLRDELRHYRKNRPLGRAWRWLRSLLSDYPGIILIFLSLLALLLSVWTWILYR
ncbi:MAG: hypothetical protein KatS3mg105_1797 [Gemmatales bacterium]|nr:MAG: hypothetical protein KatS3mg105_1797 [Gemmatales bacterium]